MIYLVSGIFLLVILIFVQYLNIKNFETETIANLEGDSEVPRDLLITTLISGTAQYKFQQKIAWLIFIICMIFLIGSIIYLYTSWIFEDRGVIDKGSDVAKTAIILTQGGLSILAFKLIKYADDRYTTRLDKLRELLA